MRFVIYGLGAIGGTIGARLHLSGERVVAIARGAQLGAVQEKGLLLRTPVGEDRVALGVFAGPEEIVFGPDDVIVMTMKSQDCEAALRRLVACGVEDQTILMVQNGVANERTALRYFTNVHGVAVMMPASFEVPGEVNAFGVPNQGIMDIGRYPSGRDEGTDTIAARLSEAGFSSTVRKNVMAYKYGKLVLNLRNIVEAAFGAGEQASAWYKKARLEAEAVLGAAGINHVDMRLDPRRQELMQDREIVGVKRIGSSTLQSLVRSAGSIETDYLNGEIVLMGRLHGVETPVNRAFCKISQLLLTERLRPGAVTEADVMALIQVSCGAR